MILFVARYQRIRKTKGDDDNNWGFRVWYVILCRLCMGYSEQCLLNVLGTFRVAERILKNIMTLVVEVKRRIVKLLRCSGNGWYVVIDRFGI